MSEIERRRDAGMTLPELLVAVSVLAVIATVLASAVTVTFRSEAGTKGRLNVARAEQSITLHLPADLASADPGGVDTAPDASPCPPATTSCPGIGALPGSNALLLGWEEKMSAGASTFTNVSYRLVPTSGGESYDVVRVRCTSAGGGWDCASVPVLRELAWPESAGEAPDPFVAGVTVVPQDLIQVTLPLDALSTDPDAPGSIDTTNTKNANRIVVTVDGGGRSDGSGGGVNRISITAGGTFRTELEAGKLSGPSFLQAKSRCGGPITLVVDESNSIGSAIGNVRTGVTDFVRALEGTPVQLRIVRFETGARDLGTDGWYRSFDMSNPADFAALLPLIGELQGDWTGVPGRGGTNYEDAFFRTIYSATGQRLDDDGDPTTSLPKLVVFFTDGVPTFDRTVRRDGGPPPGAEPPILTFPWPASTGGRFSQVAWDRSNHLVRQIPSSVRLLGVGAGPDFARTSYAFTDPGNGVRYSGTSAQVRRNNGTWVTVSESSGSDQFMNAGFNPVSNFTGLRGGRISNTALLGKLIVGGSVSSSSTGWVESRWNGSEWPDVEVADVLIVDEWARFSSALVSIALAECGGTLSLQTRLGDGSRVDAEFTYESGGETVTTGRVVPTATFDIPLNVGTIDVDVRPLAVPGFTSTGWSCRAQGADLPASEWSLRGPSPADGITVQMTPNRAVSCVMTVAPS